MKLPRQQLVPPRLNKLRNNKNQSAGQELLWKTAFKIPLNFENTLNWNYTKSKSENQTRAFDNEMLQNNFKVIFKAGSQWFCMLSNDYYLPDTSKKTNFFFIDVNIRYHPKRYKWEASLSFKNLTNQRNFEQVRNQ